MTAEEWNEQLRITGEDRLPLARDLTGQYTDAVREVPGAATEATGKVQELAGAAELAAGDYYLDFYVRVHGEIPSGGSGGGQQMGTSFVNAPIGQPVWSVLHGGEIVINPFEMGAVGNKLGPRAPANVSYGGDTYHVNLGSRAAVAEWEFRQKRKRYNKASKRVRGR